MANSKIDFTFDNLHFSCEGEQDWVENQLNRVLNRIPGLNTPELFFQAEKVTKTRRSRKNALGEGFMTRGNPVEEIKEKVKRGRKPKVSVEQLAEELPFDPLVEFLKEKNADTNQVKKFLATAVYLHSQGFEKFSTPVISQKLKESHIVKLLNASDCLNKNEMKGFCVKEDKDFILTEAGIRSILKGAEE